MVDMNTSTSDLSDVSLTHENKITKGTKTVTVSKVPYLLEMFIDVT